MERCDGQWISCVTEDSRCARRSILVRHCDDTLLRRLMHERLIPFARGQALIFHTSLLAVHVRVDVERPPAGKTVLVQTSRVSVAFSFTPSIPWLSHLHLPTFKSLLSFPSQSP